MSAPYGNYQGPHPSEGYGYNNNPPPYAPQDPNYKPENQPYYDPNVDPLPNHDPSSAVYQGSRAPLTFPPPSAIAGLRAFTPEDVIEESDMDNFSDKSIRRAFIKKVYLIVTSQLLFTLAFVILFSICKPIKTFLWTYSWIYYIAYGIFLVTYIILICVKAVRRRVPINFICLFIFTAAFTYMTATIAGYHDTYIVLIALAITVAVCVGITIFAIQTKIDFTMCSGLLLVLTLVVLLFGIAIALTYAFTSPDKLTKQILQCVYGAVCALLFSMYLVFDTQMLMGNKTNSISEEEYIYAALQLYLDMIQIFLVILHIAGAINK